MDITINSGQIKARAQDSCREFISVGDWSFHAAIATALNAYSAIAGYNHGLVFWVE